MTTYEVIERFYENHYDLYKLMKETEHGYLGIHLNPMHAENVWAHTLMVLKEAEQSDLWMKVACLCHDIGKVFVFQDNFSNQRRRFNNHEAVSTFYAAGVIKSFPELEPWDKARILKVIANHGALYNFFEDQRIPEKHFKKIRERFRKEDLKDMFRFYRYDHQGRVNNAKDNHEVYHDFDDILRWYKEDQTKVLPPRMITLLVGLPSSGKSTKARYLKEQNPDSGVVIISRDDTLMEYSNNETYNEVFLRLGKEEHKEIDKKIQQDFQGALRDQKDIVIDMTNMSKKSRKKWLHDSKLKGYFKKCIVFLESKDTCLGRNTKDKKIPEEVYDNMMQRFVYPDYTEFDMIHQSHEV